LNRREAWRAAYQKGGCSLSLPAVRKRHACSIGGGSQHRCTGFRALLCLNIPSPPVAYPLVSQTKQRRKNCISAQARLPCACVD